MCHAWRGAAVPLLPGMPSSSARASPVLGPRQFVCEAAARESVEQLPMGCLRNGFLGKSV